MARFLVPALAALALIAPLRGADPPAAPVAAPATDKANEASPAEIALMAAARLADIEFQHHYEGVVVALSQSDQALRIKAIRELGRLQVDGTAALLISLLEPLHNNPEILMAASESLADLGAATATTPLLRLLGHGDPAVRACAQKSLTRLSSMGATSYQSRGKDVDDGLRASAVTNLGTLKHAEAAPLLISALRYDSRAHVRRMAAISLGKLGDRANAQTLMDALCDADPGVRRYSAESLVQLGAVESIPNLLMALEANVAPNHINRCLHILSGQDFGFDPRGNVLDRTAAIERGYEWWSLNAKSLAGK